MLECTNDFCGWNGCYWRKKKKKTWFLKCWENDQINGFSNDLEIKQYAYKASKQHIQCNEEKVPKQITYRIQLNTV